MQKLLFLFLIFLTCVAQAQFGPQQIISTEANGTRSIFVIDIDGDNLPDVVSANTFGSSVTWYKNLDGANFGVQSIIGTINQPINVYSADIDGDLDMDVISQSNPDDLIVWYENLDGLGNFSNQKIISDTEDGTYEILTADLDGDTDLDVISGSDSLGLSWFENLDGEGNFGPKKLINSTASNPRSIVAIDLDGDTDLDILAGSSGSVTVTWYENLDGAGNFGAQQVIAPSALAVETVFAADLDGDLDNDVLAGTLAADRLVWYENLDGMGNFSTEIVITTQADGINTVFAADLDNDDDIDALTALFEGGKIAWYENLDGMGNMGAQQIITTNCLSPIDVFAADIDNDGDQDVFSASIGDNKIAWYENLTILGVADVENSSITLSPNPVEDILYISSEQSVKSLKIYDLQGRLLLLNETNSSSIDMSHLPAGLYLVELITVDGSLVKKVVKK